MKALGGSKAARIVLSLALPLLVAYAAAPARAFDRTLADVERQVALGHPKLKQISSEDLAANLAAGRPWIVFDVREEGEFRVSRIPGAIRVDPSSSSSEFLASHATMAAGKEAVFYCSVGMRSSRLAARVGANLQARGVRGVYNLEGGIFRWHSEGKSLVNGAGPTLFVHPYDSTWGRLLAHRELARTKPE